MGSTPVHARVVIQALICSDSYQKIAHSVDTTPPGSTADNSELELELEVEEWHTKEKSATLVQAIVVRVDDPKPQLLAGGHLMTNG